jgi:hypothetical protein
MKFEGDIPAFEAACLKEIRESLEQFDRDGWSLFRTRVGVELEGRYPDTAVVMTYRYKRSRNRYRKLIWTLARHFPEAVLEANFRPHSSYERSRIRELSDRVVEVNCQCPPEVASKRYSARARSGRHHPTHVLPDLPRNFEAEYDMPIGIGTVIKVDTTKTADVRSLAREIAALLD